jgi:hypothetical protein
MTEPKTTVPALIKEQSVVQYEREGSASSAACLANAVGAVLGNIRDAMGTMVPDDVDVSVSATQEPDGRSYASFRLRAYRREKK